MNDALTHATTVPQPLAWAAAAGYCPVLMSDTRPEIAREGEPLGIHASRVMLREDEWTRYFGWPITGSGRGPVVWPAAYTRGALIGVARLVGVVRRQCAMDPRQVDEYIPCVGRSLFGRPVPRDLRDRIRPWWRSGSRWGLLLTDAVLLPEPIPMRGAGGVWFIPSSNPMAPSELASRVLEQWRKARVA